jgi:two-component SAPR family response regulator
VVEDEPLVALAISETLGECGFEVVGPCSSVSEALRTIRSEEFDAAVLDVNLNGEMIYPAAEVLTARNIPFIFVTGYSCEGIDSRFKNIVAMHKPIDREKLARLFRSAYDAQNVRSAS